MSMHAIAFGMLAPTYKGADGQDIVTWPEIGGFAVLAIIFLGLVAAIIDIWKTKRVIGQETALRELVNRYEQLAASTMDAQQRTSTDVAELRSRATSIEQILRSVE